MTLAHGVFLHFKSELTGDFNLAHAAKPPTCRALQRQGSGEQALTYEVGGGTPVLSSSPGARRPKANCCRAMTLELHSEEVAAGSSRPRNEQVKTTPVNHGVNLPGVEWALPEGREQELRDIADGA